MKIAITGSTGLVGSSLVPLLRDEGHHVLPMVRRSPASDQEVFWSPTEGADPGSLDGVEAIVHLAGENIAAGRWTAARKRLIHDSRVQGTRALCESLARMKRPPAVLVAASAIGFYGDRGEEWLREDSPPGQGFLAEVCQGWEKAAEPARNAGVRVVQIRFGVILSATEGALAKMLTPFRLGLGGKVGAGDQYMSWISIDDAAGAVSHALGSEALQGPVNGVAPSPVTNLDFTRALGRALSRPTLFPLPAFAARLAFGEMADALLLASTRVEPARLRDSGYSFRHPRVEDALRHVLARPGRPVRS